MQIGLAFRPSPAAVTKNGVADYRFGAGRINSEAAPIRRGGSGVAIGVASVSIVVKTGENYRVVRRSLGPKFSLRLQKKDRRYY